ncbi:hypothetical protein QZH41_009765, partial [Actinostola sp. cb2023]
MNLRELIVKLKCLPRLTALAVYILIGAAIFVKLEKTEEPNEVVANRILKAVQERISLQFGINITDQEFMSVVDNITEAAVIRARPDWTFWRAFDFSLLSLTTIVPTSEIFVQSGPSAKARWDFVWCNVYFRGQQTGTPDENGCYGDIAPRSPIGQGVFIIYALIGLPLAMVTLKYTGEFMSVCLGKIVVAVEKKIL